MPAETLFTGSETEYACTFDIKEHRNTFDEAIKSAPYSFMLKVNKDLTMGERHFIVFRHFDETIVGLKYKSNNDIKLYFDDPVDAIIFKMKWC